VLSIGTNFDDLERPWTTVAQYLGALPPGPTGFRSWTPLGDCVFWRPLYVPNVWIRHDHRRSCTTVNYEVTSRKMPDGAQVSTVAHQPRDRAVYPSANDDRTPESGTACDVLLDNRRWLYGAVSHDVWPGLALLDVSGWVATAMSRILFTVSRNCSHVQNGFYFYLRQWQLEQVMCLCVFVSRITAKVIGRFH